MTVPIAARFVRGESVDGGVVAGTATLLATLPSKVGPPGPAGAGLPSGGSTGQLLRKASSTDFDYEWSSALDSPITIDGGLL